MVKVERGGEKSQQIVGPASPSGAGTFLDRLFRGCHNHLRAFPGGTMRLVGGVFGVLLVLFLLIVMRVRRAARPGDERRDRKA